MSYKKFSQLEFLNEKHKIICEQLLHDIQSLEFQIMYDDEIVDYIKERVGLNTDDYNNLNKRILSGLKISFWYYTGANPGKVILDTVQDKEQFDIFNPLSS
jgi:hypothetical protein